jgi:hypothetical protein
MTTNWVLNKGHRFHVARMKAELNTALQHVYEASQGLNRIVLADVSDHGQHTPTLVAIARMRGQLFDIWLDGALLVTGLQQSEEIEREVIQLQKERR